MVKRPIIRLKMLGNHEVKDLLGFREHFDWDLALQYFCSGELRMWLRARYYDYEADALENLNERDAEFPKKFCEILGVELDSSVEYVLPTKSLQTVRNMSQITTFGRTKNTSNGRQSRILAMPSSSFSTESGIETPTTDIVLAIAAGIYCFMNDL